MDLFEANSNPAQSDSELNLIPLRYRSAKPIVEYIKRVWRSQGIDGDSVALRTGSRIRVIRKTLGLSQGELGQKTGLTADRVQKYENGARKPNPEQLQDIAAGLGVNVKFLVDPIISDSAGAVSALFDMEMFYNLKICQQDGRIILSFEDCSSVELNEYLKEWEKVYSSYIEDYENATSEVEAQMITDSYNKWKYSFLGAAAEGGTSMSEEQMLEEQIEVLKLRLKKIKEDAENV